MPSAFSPSFPLWEESFMKSCYYLVLALLLLVITPVAAADVVTSENLGYERTIDESLEIQPGWGCWYNNPGLEIKFVNGIEYFDDFEVLFLGDLSPSCVLNPEVNTSASTPFTVSNGEIAGKIHYNVHFVDGKASKVQVWLTFDHFAPTGTGTVRYVLIYDKDAVSYVNVKGVKADSWPSTPFACFSASESATGYRPFGGEYINIYREKFEHDYVLTEYEDEYVLDVFRHGYQSTIELKDALYDLIQIPDYGTDDFRREIPKLTLTPPIYLNITDKNGEYFYRELLVTETPITPTPTDPGESPTLRTGSVTMTDHNGTSISGFEVTAVNHYTGEEYTVSTDTDVAVISLPMDRTVEIRNPQTGAYEEAPVGYYRFYGQAPGYKMLNEEGIKVSVMPEKYGSYKLCDILVTPESGYLTGTHKFQIRSRADNSILQTGTISAKSRTTGDWYNTTVVNGLATLILPYDTSDALSERAGHYYVYATSPGYEDSDYGTQIIVTPQTVSEVRTILLTPIGGVPTPGNVTLRIQTISETGQSVDNAEIFIAGVLGAGKDVWDTYTTSWTGFIEVSVPGNSTYDIVARAAGYYDSSRRIEVFIEDPPIIEMRLYLSGAPTIEPTTEPTGWVTGPPTTQPTGGIPDEDDGSDGFLMEAVRGIGNAFGVGFATAKIIFGMLLALAIGFATAKQLRGGAAEFGLGMLGGTMLGVLVGLIPVWTIVVLLLVVGLYIGNRYVGGGNNG